MAMFEIIRETGKFEIVAVLVADSPKRAKEMAKALGYEKGYTIEQVQEAHYDR